MTLIKFVTSKKALKESWKANQVTELIRSYRQFRLLAVMWRYLYSIPLGNFSSSLKNGSHVNICKMKADDRFKNPWNILIYWKVFFWLNQNTEWFLKKSEIGRKLLISLGKISSINFFNLFPPTNPICINRIITNLEG